MKRREKRERKEYFRRAGFAAAFAAAAVIASGTPAYAKTAKKVAITPSVVTVYTGKTKKLTLKNNTRKVKWSASSKAVTLSKKGKKGVTVTGKKAGTATVSAIIGKKKYKAKINVKKTGLSTAKITMKAGTSYTLKLNGDSAKTWSSSSVSAVKISSKKAGSIRLTAVKAGKSVITAKTAKGKKYSCTVTVKAAKNTSSSKTAQKPSVTAAAPAVSATPSTVPAAPASSATASAAGTGTAAVSSAPATGNASSATSGETSGSTYTDPDPLMQDLKRHETDTYADPVGASDEGDMTPNEF